MLRAQLETDRLDDQLITLRRQKQVAQADLATLLQQPVDLLPEATDELGITDTPQQIEELIALAEQCNPKLRGLAWEIQRDRDKERLACLQQYPDFNVGLSWGLISDGHDVISPVANGNDNLSISFRDNAADLAREDQRRHPRSRSPTQQHHPSPRSRTRRTLRKDPSPDRSSRRIGGTTRYL